MSDQKFDPTMELPVTPENVAEHARNMEAFQKSKRMSPEDVRKEDLIRVSKDPEHFKRMIGEKKFDELYPELAGEQKMAGRIGPDGKAMIAPMVGGDKMAEAVLELDRQSKAALDGSQDLVDKAEDLVEQTREETERMEALLQLIRDHRMDERNQIVAVVMAYAEDCEERAGDLFESGKRERKRLRKTGHVTEAEQIRKMQEARSSAFRVRAAIATDIAHKIEIAWGRNPDGSPMEKVDADSGDVIELAAKKKKGS